MNSTLINPSNTSAVDYRAEGNSCIFGGWESHYKKNGQKITCPALNEHANCDTQDGKNAEKGTTFRCNTFSVQNPEVLSSACIKITEPDDLKFLTKRCVNAIIVAIEKLPSLEIDKNKLNETLRQFGDAVKNFEDKDGFYGNYCAKNNQLNKNRQAVECQSISELIAVFKKAVNSGKFPTEQVLVQKTATTIQKNTDRPATTIKAKQ